MADVQHVQAHLVRQYPVSYFREWLEHYAKWPPGWRDDMREYQTAARLCMSGKPLPPWEMFDSLAIIYKRLGLDKVDQGPGEEGYTQEEIDSNVFLSRLQEANMKEEALKRQQDPGIENAEENQKLLEEEINNDTI